MDESKQVTFGAEVRTLVFALLVTALIWVWAEGQSVSGIAVPVRVALPDGSSGDLELDSPELSDHTASAVLRFEGATLALDAATSLRGATLTLEPGSPGLPTGPGPSQVVDLQRALARNPEVARLGVPLSSVEPASLVVSAVRLATRELPVRVELAREIPLAGDPLPGVQKVRVRVPEALVDKIPAGTQVVATISEEQLLSLRGEGLETVKAVCRLPAALGDIKPVRFQPDSVSVALRVRQALETAKLPAGIPVWYSLPPTEDSSRWAIEVVDKFLPEVTVTGPAEQIARLSRGGNAGGNGGNTGAAGNPPAPTPAPTPGAGTSAGEPIIKALVELTSDELARATQPASGAPGPGAGKGAVLTKPVVFTGLPPNVSVLNPPTVQVRVSKAGSGGGGAGGASGGAGVTNPTPSEAQSNTERE